MRVPRYIYSLVALLALAPSLTRGAIESNFDDQVFPGEAGNGWVTPWQNPSAGTPVIASDAPMDGSSPYVRLDMTGTSGRNLMRQYESGGGVDITQPYLIQWKFRLVEPDFATTFSSFNDRVHFFGRSAPRLTASTDASVSWAIIATGGAHSSGAGAGQTFWIYDNVEGNSAFNAQNHVDSQVPLQPGDVYSFAVLISPNDQTYLVTIENETTGASFTSSAPHRFRDLSTTATSHNLAHFGVFAGSSSLARGFDLDSVTISPAPLDQVPPQIINIIPEPDSFHVAAEGMQFEAVSAQPIPVEGISVILNGTDISDALTMSGEAEHRTVRYDGLAANLIYTIEITVSNALGTASSTFQFNTSEGRTALYDSGGFENESVYPEGSLGPVTDGGGTWAPAPSPAQIVDLADGQFGQVLRREQMGSDNTDVLNFGGASVGILIIEFDARVSVTTGRTLDLMLLPASGGQMASMLGWGINAGKVAYYDGSAWVSAADIDTEWHHYEMINYLSGPLARTWDFKIDGVLVGRGLPWRHAIAAGTSIARVRVGAIRGPVGEYADIDNVVVSVEPEPPPAPLISNITPAHRTHFYPVEGGIQFEATSEQPILSSGIRLVLNEVDVSDQLTVSGDSTNRTVQFLGLVPNEIYTAEIEVGNALGENAATIQFDTIITPTAIVDVDEFSDASRYPVGPLTAVTEDHGVWTPGRTGAPSELVNVNGEHGVVLRRAQTDSANSDLLDFVPFTEGVLTIEFDARVSSTTGRTLDLSLNRTGQDQRASSLAWGAVPGRLAYERGGTWVDFADIDDQWHRYRLVNHLEGARAQTFDVFIDGELVGESLPWNQNFGGDTAVFGRLRIGAEAGLSGDFADIDNLVVRAGPPAPEITGFVPSALSMFHMADTGLQFQVSSGAELSSDAIKVVINGVDVTESLEITGQAPTWTVTYPNLKPGTFYTAEISVTAATGTSSVIHQFATFEAGGAVVIEAEDYNFEAGQFLDDPPPSGYRADGTQVNGNIGYVDLAGTEEIDYFIAVPPTGDFNQIYRFLDEVGTRYTADALRQKYVDAQVPDYEVWSFTTGDWLNYTRTFAAGKYHVFLRAASSEPQTVALEAVTSDRAAPGQTTEPLGVFNIPDTAGSYTHVPLTAAGGGALTLELEGVETLRLSGAEANAGLQMNFLLFVAASDEAGEIVLSNPDMAASGFSFSFTTEAGRSYTAEYTESLTAPQWRVLQTVTGTGSVETVTDTNAAGAQRYYRVRTD